MNVRRAGELFIEDRLAKGLSTHTIEFYKRCVQKCTVGIETTDEIDVNKTILRLRSEVNEVSVYSYSKGIKAFLRFLSACGALRDTIRVPTIPEPTQEIKPLRRAEFASLIGLYEKNTFIHVRNRAMMMAFLDTGVRCQEMTGLRDQDVRWKAEVMRVLGKGNKPRAVPFGKKTREQLWKYWLRKETLEPETDALWITKSGDPLTASGIKMIFNRAKDKTGIKRLCPHLMRHTFAMWWIENGGDPFSLQTIMGHASINTTKRYVNMSMGHLVAAHRKYSPIESDKDVTD